MQYCYGCMKPIETDDHMCGACGFDARAYVVAPHHLPPGTVLHERYLLGKVLGEGGFGITYVGRDTLLDMKVAVKEFYMNGYVNRNNTVSYEVLASVGTGSDLFAQNKAKFIEEARVLARFSNEVGIVGIRDFFEENGTAYMIMDFIEGTTLRTYLEKKGKMPMRDVITIMEPVMHALQHVHEQNVIHRDISPDNIMITPEKQIKLLDFGAAREISKNDAKSLSVILKPGYAPEEQYRSRGQQGTWTDVYALSATMYRCISGITPDDAMERMFEDKVKPLHQICACTPAVSSVIMKGLSVRKDGRYQSIRELRKDLERALDDPNFIVKAGTGRETAPQKPQQSAGTAPKYVAPQQRVAGKTGPSQPTSQQRVTTPQPQTGNRPVSRQPVQTGQSAAPVRQGTVPQQRTTAPQPRNPQTVPPAARPAAVTAPQQRPAAPATQPVRPAGQTPQQQNRVPRTPGATQQQTVQTVNASQPVPAAVPKQPQAQGQRTAQVNQPAGRKKKKWLIPVIIAGALTVLGIIGAIVGITSDASKNRKMHAGALPDAVADYSFCIDDSEYQLPAAFWDFEVQNWIFVNDDDREKLLAPGETVRGVELENSEYGLIEVTFHNPTPYTLLMMDTQIEAVSLDSTTLGAAQTVSVFRTGRSSDGSYLFALGSSAKKELKSVFGKPMGGTYLSMIDDEHYCRILTEDKDRITVIELYNRAEDAFDTAAFMDTAPGLIRTSEKGPGLEQDGLPFVLCLVGRDGTLKDYYGFGVRLQEYMDGGFEIQGAPDYLGGRHFTNVQVVDPGSVTLTVTVCNPFDEPLQIGQCFTACIDGVGVIQDDSVWLIYDIANDSYIGYVQEKQDDGKTLTSIGYPILDQTDDELRLQHEKTGAAFWIRRDPGDSENMIKDVNVYALDYVFLNPDAIVERE